MSYHDFKSEWDDKPALLENLPLYVLRAWRDTLREPVYDAVCWQSDRAPFDEIMDRCDTGNFSREWHKWMDSIKADIEVSSFYIDRLRWLSRYRAVVTAIEHVEAREIAELLAGRAA